MTLFATLIAVFATLPVMATTYSVTNLNDAGAGSLRQALTDANSNPTNLPHTISFDSSLNGTIQLDSELPTLFYDMTLNGPGSQKVMIRRNAVAEFRILTANTSLLTVNGLTISNGVAEDGGGIYVAGALTVDGCVIINNTAIGADSYSDGEGSHSAGDAHGGGLYSELDMTVTNSTISNNLVIGGTDVIGNQYGGNADGGGIFCVSEVSILNSSIFQNTALGGDSDGYRAGDGLGGGIYANNDLIIVSSSIGTNTATGGDSLGSEPDEAGNGFGGGAYVLGDCTVSDVSISGNRAISGDSTAFIGNASGGGILVDSGEAQVTIDNSSFANNTAEGVSGSLVFGGGAYGAGFSAFYCEVEITNTSFTGNVTISSDAEYGISSALDLYGCYTGVKNCVFTGNDVTGDASYSGTIVVDGGFLSMVNTTVADNTNVNESGGLFTSSNSSMVVSCIFWGNTNTQIYVEDASESEGETISQGEGESSAGVTFSIVEGGFAGTGNLDSDPLFRDTSSNDYQLLPGSPAIDSGDDGLHTEADILGNYRVDDSTVPNTGSGIGYVDMGAFEFQPSQFLTQQITLVAGWNLISVPFVPVNPSILANFGSNAFAYRWDATTQDYAEITTITAGQGFFLYTDTASTVMLYSLTPASNYVRHMEYYWNVIGPTEDGQTFDAVSNIIVVYTYNGSTDSYDLVNPSGGQYTMSSGVGYYIFVYPSFDLTVFSPSPSD